MLRPSLPGGGLEPWSNQSGVLTQLQAKGNKGLLSKLGQIPVPLHWAQDSFLEGVRGPVTWARSCLVVQCELLHLGKTWAAVGRAWCLPRGGLLTYCHHATARRVMARAHFLLMSHCESVTHSVVSDPLRPHGPLPTRLLCPWDSPGKSTGVGCRALLPGVFLTPGSNPCPLQWKHMS